MNEITWIVIGAALALSLITLFNVIRNKNKK